ncbi:MAG: hypothetical protein IJ735_02795 [Clostridia bacterium]|nr:hypothetical protein [Clostridia bacterium]
MNGKNRIFYEIAARGAYVVLAVVTLLSGLGFWSIGGGSTPNGFNPWFFTNYFLWTVIMSIVAHVAALFECFSIARKGDLERYTEKFRFLKFCALSSMIFCFLCGSFFVDRVGLLRLTDSTSFGSIYPAIATAGYWLDFSVLSTFLLCPAAYIILYVLFEEKGKSRKIYAKLGIVPPTIFYLFDKIFGIIMKAIYGGNDALLEAGMYGVANPFFFYDGVTYSGWWWILLWPSIFGVGLMAINKTAFVLSRTKKIDGKLVYDGKSEPQEEQLNDIFHPIAVKLAEKKAKKSAETK